MALCPECQGSLELPDDTRASEIVDCPACSSELEVVAVSPLLVALAPEVEEDWGE